MFPDHSDWPSYSEEVKQWTCSSASCWLLKWPNTQSSIEKSSLEGNTTTQKWNLLAVNKNRTNRGAEIVSHGNSNERELDMQERKLHNINSLVILCTAPSLCTQPWVMNTRKLKGHQSGCEFLFPRHASTFQTQQHFCLSLLISTLCCIWRTLVCFLRSPLQLLLFLLSKLFPLLFHFLLSFASLLQGCFHFL